MSIAPSLSGISVPRVVLSVLLVIAAVLSRASAGLQDQAGFLWIGESRGILNIATDSAELRFEIPHPLGISGLAVNDVNGDLWAYGKKELHRYSRQGEPLTSASTLASTQGADPTDLVVDGLSGNLWMAIKRDLYRFNLEGVRQQTLTLPKDIKALALDRARSQL